MQKLLYALSLLILILSSCSSDSNTPVGHSFISFKVDGITHEYTNVNIDEERDFNSVEADGTHPIILYIRAEKDGNNDTSEDFFIIRPFRGGIKNNQIHSASLSIFESPHFSSYLQFSDQPLTSNFTINSENGIKGSFEGILKEVDIEHIVTEGYIDIIYGTSNYHPLVVN